MDQTLGESPLSPQKAPRRALWVLIYLILGIIVFFGFNLVEGIARWVYFGVVPVGLGVLAVIFWKTHPQYHRHEIFAAFMLAAIGVYAQLPWAAGSTMQEIVWNKMISTGIVVGVVLGGSALLKTKRTTLLLTAGDCKWGAILGGGTVLLFGLTSTVAATFLFGGQDITLARVGPWIPWIGLFVISNGIREEILFRGLFLRRYEAQIGETQANFLQALIFAAAHCSLPVGGFTVLYIGITFLLGTAFGATMQKTHSIWPAILFHAAADIPVIMAVFSVL